MTPSQSTDDLVKRLRDADQHSEEDCYEAADTIERLQRELAATHVCAVAWETGAKELQSRLDARDKTIETMQAKIDALMWEYCPDEMTPEQVAEYERNIRVAARSEESKTL